MDFDDGYIFVVDTNRYAGNFEREMCAFMTGILGASGVGAGEAAKFFEDLGLTSKEDQTLNNPFADLVVQIPRDSECCYSPCCVWSNEIHSIAIFFRERPPGELLAIMKERARQFCKGNRIVIHGFRLLKKQSMYVEEIM
ncbi:MAG: hypothetical protein HYS15_01755 [Candidatus Spechtbacteria bacterium]|nr:hypothetical protein [Candidatus Spechtbacteria bacterium]